MNAHNEQQPAAAQEAAGWQVFNSVVGAWQDASKSQYESRKAHYPEEARELYAAPVAAAPVDAPTEVEWMMACNEIVGSNVAEEIITRAYSIAEMPRSTPAAPGIDTVYILEIVAKYVGRTSNAYRYIAEDLRLIDASPKDALPTLPDDFSESKDWRAGSYEERVEWLMDTVRSQREHIDSLLDSPKGGSEAPQNGEVLVTVSGLTGSGKSAVAGEIEILCKALGLEVEWTNGDEEKYLTHADWTEALELYKPRVRIVEINIPRVQAGDAEVQP